MDRFLGAAGLGLSTSLSCAFTCLPVHLPFCVSEDGRRDLGSVGMLLAGRLAAYLLVGALAGSLGGAFRAETVARASAWSMIPLCALLFLRAAGVFRREVPLCGALARFGEAVRSPLLVGFLLGFSICPPFLIAIAQAAASGGAPEGIVVFAGFFLGTSAFLVPLFLLPLAQGRAFREWLGRAAPVAAAAFALLFLARALALLFPAAPTAAASRTDVERLFPAATALEREGNAVPPHWLVYGGKDGGTLLGYAVESRDCAPDIRGYGGPIPLLVALDPRGTVLSVRVLPNRETPSYTGRVFSDGYLCGFAGATARDALRVGENVDAVSGSTVTREALAATLRATLRVFSMKVLADDAPPAAEGTRVTRETLRIPVFLLLAAGSVPVLLFGRRRRLWFLPGTVLLLGVLFPAYAGIADVVRLLFGAGFPSAAPLIVFGTAAALALAFGRHYCSLLCPYGALQELLHAVSPVRRPVSPRLDGTLRAAKYVLLLLVPVLYALLGFAGLAFEPFDVTFRVLRDPASLPELASSGLPVLLLAVLLLAAGLVTERFWCKYLCPLGAAFALLASARIVRRAPVPGRTCAGCSQGIPGDASECFLCGGRKP